MAIQKPTNLILTKIGDSVRIEWQDNQLTETVGFKVKRNNVEIATLPQNSVITKNGLLNPVAKSQDFVMSANQTDTTLFNYTVTKSNYSNITDITIYEGDTLSGKVNYQLYQTIVTLNNLIINDIKSLDSITCTNNDVYLMFSVDNGTTWNYFDTSNTTWKTVDIANIDDVALKSNSIGVVNSLSSSNWETLRGTSNNLRVAYYILLNDTNKYTNNKIIINYKNNSDVVTINEITHSVATGNSASFTDITPIKGITNTYEVYSYNATEQSESLIGTIVIAPNDVINGNFVTNGYNITFSWETVPCDGYKIYDESNNLITTTTTNSYIWTNESQTEQYKTIKVSAYNSGGESNKLSITGETIPNAPSLLMISQVSNGLRLNWTNNSLINDGYKIQKRVEGGSWSDVANVTTKPYTDVFPINRNTLYEYQVCAYNTVGNSAYTTWGTYVVDSVVLSYSYDEIENQIVYYWDESIGCTGYKLYITENGVTQEYVKTATNHAVIMNREFIQSAYVVAYIEDEDLGYFESEHSNIVTAKTYPINKASNINYSYDMATSIMTITFKDTSIVEDGFRVWYRIDNNSEEFIEVPTINSVGIDDIYTVDISLENLYENFSFYIETYSDGRILSAKSSTITPMARPKALSLGYVLGNAKFGWIDNTDNEQKYKLYYKINNGVEQILEVTSSSVIETGKVYTVSIPMDIASTISGYICALDSNGVSGIPSEIVTTSFATYQKEPTPTDFKVSWESLGVAKYTWTCNSEKMYGYKLTYQINEGEFITVDFPSEPNNVGQEYSYSIPLGNVLDRVSGYVEGYTLIDTTPQTEMLSLTYIKADTSPLNNFWKERTDNGYLFKWDIRDYVVDYEVHYTINNVENVQKTLNNYFELPLDSSIQSISIYVFANFSSLEVSEHTNTISFVPTTKVTTNKTIIYNSDMVAKTLDTNISQFRIKFMFTDCLLTSNNNILNSKSSIETKTMEYAVDYIGYLKEVIIYHTSIKVSDLLAIKNSTSSTCYVNTKNYSDNLVWLNNVETASVDRNIKNIFRDSLAYINNNVTGRGLSSMAIRNENLKLSDYKINFISYETVKSTGFMVGNVVWTYYQILYGVYTEVHKIRVCCLGDSITAGHPNYWAENERNHIPNTGSGRITSQYEYWLQKRLQGDYEVINNGYGSDTTEKMLKRFDKDVLAMSPQYVIIQGGTNDINVAMTEKKNDQAYLDAKMENAKQNIIQIVNKCFENDITPIIGTLIPRTSAQGIYRTALWDFNKWIIAYCNGTDGVYYADFYNAGKSNMPPTPLEEPTVAGNLNPLYDGDSIFDTYGNLTRRGYGVHPNDLGYKIMAEAVPLNIFKGLSTGVKLYIDSNCTVEENSDGSDFYHTLYNITFNNLDRGRTKIITRYLKNIGNIPVLYSVYNQLETGVDMLFSTDGINYYENISGKLDNETVNTIYIKVAVPRTGALPTVSTILSTRSIKVM